MYNEKEFQAKYRKTHRSYYTEYNKKYNVINQEKLKGYRKQWRKTHPDYQKNYRAKQKLTTEEYQEEMQQRIKLYDRLKVKKEGISFIVEKGIILIDMGIYLLYPDGSIKIT